MSRHVGHKMFLCPSKGIKSIGESHEMRSTRGRLDGFIGDDTNHDVNVERFDLKYEFLSQRRHWDNIKNKQGF